MDDLLSQLRDIRGLDPVSWWPPAPVWWVLLGVFIFIVAVFVLFKLRYRRPDETDWQSEALDIIKDLRANQEAAVKQRVSTLSELLRRIAIRRYGRSECAGLQGKSWLTWLAENDPDGFSWDRTGLVLIEAPYLPDDVTQPAQNWSELLDAAEKWIK